MPWARLDDSLIDHPKFNELMMEPDGWAAFGFWSAMLIWANKHTRKPSKTPGLLKRADVYVMDRANAGRYAGLLVKVGFWELRDDGWMIHDFADFLPSERKLAAQRENASKGGLAKAAKRALATGQKSLATGQDELATGLPNSSHALGTGRGSSKDLKVVDSPVPRASARGTRLPADFQVTPDMVTWKRENFPGVNGKAETDKFIDHWTAASGQSASKKDWVAAWRNWIRNAAERTGQAPPPPATVSPRDEFMRRR